MPITREKKAEIIKELENKIKQAQMVVFLNFHGLKVKDGQNLRRDLKKEKLEYKVAKKTLIKIALQNLNLAPENINLEGEIALGFSKSGELVLLPKILFGFQKTHPEIKVLGGLFENRYIDAARLEEISKLPPRDILYANLVGQLSSPLRSLIITLRGPMNNFGRIIYQLSQNKQ